MSLKNQQHVLGEGGTGEHHIAPGILSLHFELALQVGEISQEADVFRVGVGFQVADELQRLGGFEVQIENDQAGLVLFGFLEDFAGLLDEFQRQSISLGCFADLDRKKQVVYNRQNSLRFLLRHSL